MRFKKHQGSQLPEVNLVPMMDVLMTILTFFIIISMTLTSQQVVENVSLPTTREGTQEQNTPDPLVVGLNQQGQIVLDNSPVSEAELIERVQSYLAQNAEGAVILKADRQLSYRNVAQVLGTMRDVGGDRVSLAIESN